MVLGMRGHLEISTKALAIHDCWTTEPNNIKKGVPPTISH